MKRKSLLILLGSAVVLSLVSASMIRSTGMSQYTNSPPDGPGDCTGCHGGGSVTPVVHFSAVPAFGTGMTYMPGVTYTISYQTTGYSDFGFDLEMLNSNTTAGVDAGTLVSALTHCQFMAATNGTTGTGSTKNVTHTSGIASTSSATFTWKSPASGDVYVYSTSIGCPSTSGTQSPTKMVQFNTILYPSPTGIAENTEAFNLNVFPNPATDNLHLTYTLNKPSSVLIQLYDMQGKMVADLFNQTEVSGNQDMNLALPSSVSKGIYSLQLNIDGVPAVKKIVIQ
jgi:hypothetical protein